MSYKTLGDYIQPVNNRNRPLVTEDLRGLSMTKEFRKSTSNIIGVDLTKYKLVYKNHFSCDFMSVIRVHKLPVVLHTENEPVIVSPAYTVFEVKDETELSPEYLMMWFRRSEFDRYADFRCDSAVRGGFMWNELCETQLPIPCLEKQQQIVAEYNTVTNRIKLNKQINQKLESTAQGLYKHWFVDFEFPNAENKPYKSSGGVMVYNEELDKDIPVGWSFGTLGDISTQFSGFSFKGDKYSYNKGITVVRGENVSEQKLRWDTRKKWNHKLEERIKKCFLQADDLLIGMDGSKIGKNWSLVSEFELPLLLAQRVTSVRAINKIYSFFIYISFSVCDFKEYVYQVKTGTSIPHISGKQIKDFPMITPTDDIAEKFDAKTRIMFNAIFTNTQASKTLQDLQSLLLAKMTQQESKAQAV